MTKLLALTAVVVFILAASPCLAGIPHLIHYQGMLTDDAGNPLNAPQSLTFRIYNLESGGSSLWGETQNNVQVNNGLFNVVLGSVTPIELPFDEDYWLEIEVGVLGSLSPRIRLTSVGYAYRAETDGDWTVSGNNMYSTVSGNVGIGTTAPEVKLHIKGEGYYPFVKTEVIDETGAGVQLTASGVLTEPGGTNQWGLFIRASDNSGDLYINEDYVGGAWSPTTRFVVENETGNVGIGTTDPAHKLDVAGTVQMTGFKMPGGATNGYVLTSDGSGVGTWQEAAGGEIGGSGTSGYISKFTSSTAIGNSAIYQSGNNLGIGTTSPAAPLTIYPIIGTEILLTGGGSNADIKSTNQFTVGTSTISPFSLVTSNVNRLWITGDGDIGIGTTSPDEKLHVNGNLKVTGKINGAIGLVAAGTYASYLYEGFNVTSITYNSGENRYEITLTGISYDYREYVTVVTPAGTTPYFVSTNSVSNKLLICFYNTAGNPVEATSFHFAVYDIE